MAKETGRAMVWTAIDTPLEPREYPLPEVEDDAMLVKITMACICGSDLHSYKGEYVGRLKPSREKPLIMGHEMTGRVYRMGRNVKTDYLGRPLKEGDRIIYSYFNPCGKCWACVTGSAPCPHKHRFRKTSEEFPHFRGAFAEYYYLKGDQWVFKVPDELPDETVAPVNCALSTVTYGMHQIRVPLEGMVLVQGAGGLGLSAAAVAREMGAARVIVIDKLAERLKLATAFGADHTIDMNEFPTPEARLERVMQLTGGKGVDLAVEVVGRPEVIAEGLEMLAPSGTYLTMGLVTGRPDLASRHGEGRAQGAYHRRLGQLQVLGHAQGARLPRADAGTSTRSISSCRTNSSSRTSTRACSGRCRARSSAPASCRADGNQRPGSKSTPVVRSSPPKYL